MNSNSDFGTTSDSDQEIGFTKISDNVFLTICILKCL